MLQLDGERERLTCAQHEVIAGDIKAGSFSLQRVGASFHGGKTEFSNRIARGLVDNGAFSALKNDRSAGNSVAGVIPDSAFNCGLGEGTSRQEYAQNRR